LSELSAEARLAKFGEAVLRSFRDLESLLNRLANVEGHTRPYCRIVEGLLEFSMATK
jgi:hypothetical protein